MDAATNSEVAPPDLLGAALEGHGGHAAVRAIVTQPLEHGVAELLDRTVPTGRPSSLELLRSKYKAGRKLTGYYRSAGLHIAVTWSAEGAVRMLLSPADPSMPQLARLWEPAGLGGLVEELSGRVMPLSGLMLTTVRYRPGQRHVLHARHPAWGCVYLKVDRDASGAHAVPVARLLQERLVRAGSWARVAEPVGYSSTQQAALWWEAPGRPLPVALGERQAASIVEAVGRAVRVVHETGTTPDEYPPLDAAGSRDVPAEAAGTLGAGEHISALLPAVGTRYADLVAEIVDSLDRLPAEAARFTHGDLKADNLLVAGDGLQILDLDRSCWAEPAMDLGKFLADLRWWIRVPTAAAPLESAFRAGYGRCDPVRWARADLLAGLFALKFAARRCVVHDIRWPDRVREQVDRAARSLTLARSR